MSIRADVSVRPERIGHSFPTGDLFRRAELRVWADGDEAHAEVVPFARAFADCPEHLPGGGIVFVRRESDDSRVPAPGNGAPRVLGFRLSPETRRIHWSLDYLLMPSPMAAAQGFAPARNRRVIASGEIPAPPITTHRTTRAP